MLLSTLVVLIFTQPHHVSLQIVNTCDVCGESILLPSVYRKLKDVNAGPAIINGVEGSSEAYPWEVLIEQITNGTAHCVINQDPELECAERKGIPIPKCWTPVENLHISKDNYEDRFPASFFVAHPLFQFPEFQNDIALIRMQYPIRCRFGVMPICLPYPGYDGFHKELHVAGWGKFKSKYEKNIVPTKFRKGKMMMVDPEVCFAWFSRELLIEGKFICAMGRYSQQSICEGDSGSSTFVESQGLFYALGVTSLFGGTDCFPDKPDVFTKIAAYMDWVLYYVTDLPHRDSLIASAKRNLMTKSISEETLGMPEPEPPLVPLPGLLDYPYPHVGGLQVPMPNQYE